MSTREVRSIGQSRWGLERARSIAVSVAASRRDVRALVEVMFGDDVETRKRAADVARRITERDATPLLRFADELAGLLAELSPDEARTRWHLGLVTARVAGTPEQRMRAGRLMLLLAEDEGNVVRCSGIEGLGLLATQEPSLRSVAEEVIERALRRGTRAEQCRAREAARRLALGSRTRLRDAGS